MGLEKAIQYGKERRKPYTNPKACDQTCRNHGACTYCRDRRMFQRRREEDIAEQKLRDFRMYVEN